MSKEEINEFQQRIKELEWRVKHLKDLNRVNPTTGEWKCNY